MNLILETARAGQAKNRKKMKLSRRMLRDKEDRAGLLREKNLSACLGI